MEGLDSIYKHSFGGTGSLDIVVLLGLAFFGDLLVFVFMIAFVVIEVSRLLFNRIGISKTARCKKVTKAGHLV